MALHIVLQFLSQRQICQLQLVCKRWYSTLVPSHLYNNEIALANPKRLLRIDMSHSQVFLFEPEVNASSWTKASFSFEKESQSSLFGYYGFRVAIAGRRIFLVGGKQFIKPNESPSAELVGLKLKQRRSLVQKREYCKVACLQKGGGDRFIYALGGITGTGVDLLSIECYNVQTD